MSAHPVFHSPSVPHQRGRYRDWLAAPTSPAPDSRLSRLSSEAPAADWELYPDSRESAAPSSPAAPAAPAAPDMAMHPPDPDPEVDSALDGALGNGLSHGLHRWRVYTRRGDEAPSGESRGHYVRAPIFQQSVTLTAKMWPEEGDGAGGSAGGWSAWRVSGEHLPLVVGGVAGGALIVMLVVAAVVWRLCVLRRDKQYRVRMGECAPEPRPVQPVMPSESAVFASPVSGRWAYQSRLLGSPHGGSGGSGGDCSPRGTSTPPAGLRSPVPGTPPPQAWVYGDTIVADPLQRDALQAMHRAASASASASASPSPAVHRSISLQLAQQSPVSQGGRRGYPHGAVHGGAHGAGYGPSRHPGRPLSVVSSMGSYSAGCSPATPRHSAVLPPPPPEFLLPDICEFNPGAGAASVGPGAAASAQYASSSVLDDAGSLDGDSLSEALRTRSLPSSVRNKQRPIASEEDLDQLYAKVNFSKKRKNRMRHDEAAIIAISKSRSQFLDKVATDTETLVDNEAVIVYNERTAL